MGQADYHRFLMLIDQVVEGSGAVTAAGADGQIYIYIDLPGCINGAQGTFQWITNAAGQINHRFFESG
jgi:hypothetical protein